MATVTCINSDQETNCLIFVRPMPKRTKSDRPAADDTETKVAKIEEGGDVKSLPKRKLALLIGFSGIGYQGMQMYVVSLLYKYL